ncbi:sugar ABC transporter ATP-binding protein [Labrys monachus]|uniref:Ribose transport system ATP-binding protein n=1 Tax=Labrys monachus TaxID=217067 RepID=A0ABU0FJM0_9HYPH|nr:sugar ABC transporter ATP-binding protein [Labrys monachus]MDQ0394804.1 ribose transport system ATP-binding protein [Labrys monachus]
MAALLEARNLTKRYPGTIALQDVSFDLQHGEVHCLMGENGAGKSTLIKILAGATAHDSGQILIEGREVGHTQVRQRRDLGISVIYQDLNLVPQLTVAENIFLGHEPRTAAGMVDARRMERLSAELIAMLGVSFPETAKVGDLPIPLQQLTATARALSLNGKVLIMDEPSTVLSGKDLEILFDVVRRLRAGGIGIVYISHHLEEVFALGDRVTVLRDGHFVATRAVADTSKDELIRMMVGRSLNDLNKPMGGRAVGAERLRVTALSRGKVLKDISFSLHRGEVLGVAGLVGAGRTELARAIVGLDRFDSGAIHLDGQPRRIRNPNRAVALGISLVPEDRKAEGLVSVLTIRANASLSVLPRMTRFGFIRFRRLREKIDALARTMAIKAPRLDALVSGLSGGNQQKVVLAKCLATDCKVLILDEPTRGVDVGAKVEIYRLIDGLVREGMAILLISSELPEILTLSDRILVMSQGRIAAELDAKGATQEQIMAYAAQSAHRAEPAGATP